MSVVWCCVQSRSDVSGVVLCAEPVCDVSGVSVVLCAEPVSDVGGVVLCAEPVAPQAGVTGQQVAGRVDAHPAL